MPDTIIPTDEQALHNELTLTATSGASANGIDTNSATARVHRHGHPVSGQPLSFELTGHARFTQGGQHVTVTTDGRGEATVTFTDTHQEIVEVTCRHHHTQARESSRFSEPANAVLNISGEVKQNGAQANGTAQNIMLYTVYDVARAGVPNVWLDFETSGSALLSATQGQTNQSGQFTLQLTNIVQEQVLVSARVRGLVGIDNYTFLSFTTFTPQYKIVVLVEQDHSPVGQQNRINYLVLRNSNNQPVSGIVLDYTAPNNVQLVQGGPTDASGHTLLRMSSNTAGTFRITAAISTEILTHNNTDLTWGN